MRSVRGWPWSRIIALCAAAFVGAAAVRAADVDHAALPFGPEPREWVLAVVATLLGARVCAYAPGEAVGRLLVATGLAASVTVLLATFVAPDVAVWARVLTWWPTYGLLVLTAVAFPGGVRWSRGLTVLLVLVGIGALGFGVAAWSDPVGFPGGTSADPGAAAWLASGAGAALLTTVVGGGAAATRLARAARRADARSRRLLAWASLGAGLSVVAVLLEVGGLPLVWVGAAAAFPAAAVLAIVRYGLYDMDLLVHRALLYATVTVLVIAVHTAVVVGLSGAVPAAAAPVAAAIAVVVALPLRSAVARRMDRLVYGERGAPYEVMSQLGSRLETDAAPAGAMVVEAIGSALRLPSVTLRIVGEDTPLARFGRSRGRPKTVVPVSYRGERLADLVVEQRSPEEPFSRREHVLLEDLARQAGAVVSAVRLAADLQSSRERIVIAREEERRRLRHDLHDGLGPHLAGLRLRARSVRRDLGGDTTLHDPLDALDAGLRQAGEELARLVDDLRPHTLDDGLLAAIRAETDRFRTAGAPVMRLDLPHDLPGLPAAVEVAALRIVGEAVTNVVRHAGAGTCRVAVIRHATSLEIDVEDDGIGPSGTRPRGVGIASMTDRATELGGSLIVGDRGDGRGCRVRAVLPIPSPSGSPAGDEVSARPGPRGPTVGSGRASPPTVSSHSGRRASGG